MPEEQGRALPYEVRHTYALWRERMMQLCFDITADQEFMDNGDDLADFAAMMATLVTFAPQPGPMGDNEFPDVSLMRKMHRATVDRALGIE